MIHGCIETKKKGQNTTLIVSVKVDAKMLMLSFLYVSDALLEMFCVV